MLEWLTQNLATLLVGAVVAGIVAAVVVKLLRDKKRHKGACGCGCADCPLSKACHKK